MSAGQRFVAQKPKCSNSTISFPSRYFIAHASRSSRFANSKYTNVGKLFDISITACARNLRVISTMAQAKSVEYDGKEYDVVKEGLAEILNLHKDEDTQPSKKRKGEENGIEALTVQSVFYNPIQQFNRDLSVLAIKVFSEDLSLIRRNRHERRLQVSARKKKRKRNDGEPAEHAESGAAATNGEKHIQDNLVSSDGKTVPGQAQAAAIIVSSAEASSLPAEIDHVGIEQAQLAPTQAPSDQAVVNSVQETKERPRTEESAVIPEQTSTNDEAHSAPKEQIPKSGTTTKKQAEPFNDHKANPEVHTEPQSTPSFRILDALSATGLRAIRYAKEVPLATSITANDLSRAATASITLNIRHNAVGDKVIPTTGEAQVHLSMSASKPSSKYEVIDLDPYGTAVPFLDAAIQALVDGGLLCVTCTDSSLFASMGYLEKTFTLYRGLPFKGQQSHEVGLRLVLNAIATSAASYGIAIEPLLSISADFYVRLFVRVRRVISETKFLGSKTMFLYYCGEGCGAFSTQPMVQTREKKDKLGQPIYKHTQALAPTTTPTCEHCDYKLHIAGPMWGGPLHNPHFIQRILDTLPTLDENTYGTIPRIKGMLTLARDEVLLPDDSVLPSTVESAGTVTQEAITSVTRPFPSLPPSFVDPAPLFIHPPSLCKALHCTSPPDAALRGALLGLGYRVSRSHTKAGSIKTDASWSVIWEVMREWTRQKAPVKEGVVTKGTAGWGLMKRDRKNVKLTTLKEEVEAVLKEKDRLEDITNGLHAALYRATCKKPMENGETNGDIEEPQNQEEPPLGASATDSVSNGYISSSRAKNKKPKERNSYKHARQDPSRDEALRAKHQQHPTMTRPGHQLSALQRSQLEVVFDERLGSESGVKGLVRYQMNPRENWGPMKRAKMGE